MMKCLEMEEAREEDYQDEIPGYAEQHYHGPTID